MQEERLVFCNDLFSVYKASLPRIMYNRAKIKQEFWTAFGQYMSPILSAEGEKTNWVNYKTGVKNVFFRTNVDENNAYVGIELKHPDMITNEEYFSRFLSYRSIFEKYIEEPWVWDPPFVDETGAVRSRIYKLSNQANLYDQAQWPEIISFLKPRLIRLDRFWSEVKYTIE